MKKFVWRLQRLLEIKHKQEQILRAELIVLTEKSVAVRSRILDLKSRLRRELAAMKELAGQQRMRTQALYLEYTAVRDREIRGLQERWRQMEVQRRQKLQALLEVRTFKKGLQRLRARAYADYEQELNRQEQKILDECTHTDLTRKQWQV